VTVLDGSDAAAAPHELPGTKQIPAVAGVVEKDGYPPIGLHSWLSYDTYSRRDDPFENAIEVFNPEEESYASSNLVSHSGFLLWTLRTSQDDARMSASRTYDDPPLGVTEFGLGRRVFEQLQAEDPNEERDGRVIVVNQDSDEIEVHR
jgi:hypothetical protein